MQITMRALAGGALVLALASCSTSTDKAVGAPKVSTTPTSVPTSGDAGVPVPSAVVPEATTEAPSPTPSKPALTNLAPGTAITVSGTSSDKPFEMSVTLVSTKKSSKAQQQYGDAPKNGAYVGALIEYSCVSGSCDYNPYDFTLRGEDGVEFDRAFEGFTPDLNSGTLLSGTKAKGYITYDLGPGNYTLEYRSSFLDDNAASWALSTAASTA